MRKKNNETDIEKPPIFSQWKWWYLLLLGWLGLLVIFFYLITRSLN
jgi:hypothetical protein